MNTESEEIEVTQEKVEDLAEDADIDEKYVRNSMENQKADQRYERCQDQYDNNEYESERNIGDIKKAIKFLGTTIYSVPTTPNFASVVDIKAPDHNEQIIIATETDYPISSSYNIDEETATNEHKFDLSEYEDRFIFNNLLDSVNVNDPSELENEKIPIVPDQESSDYGIKPNKFKYSVDVVKPDMTLYEKTKQKFVRILMRFNCIERSTTYWGGKENKGKFTKNKNIMFYFVLFLGVLNFGVSSSAIEFVTFSTALIFVSYLLVYIYIGLYELINENEENRKFVDLRVNK